MASITVYNLEYLCGRSETFSTDVSNLFDTNFDEKVQSVHIPAGSTWMLYQKNGYQGQVKILGPGDYNTVRSLGLQNYSFSSLRPFPSATVPTVLLFKDSNYRGRMVVAHCKLSELATIGFNDAISSAIVLKSNWTFYEDADFKGTEVVLTPGRYPEPILFKDNVVSSIKPTDSSIIVYRHIITSAAARPSPVPCPTCPTMWCLHAGFRQVPPGCFTSKPTTRAQ